MTSEDFDKQVEEGRKDIERINQLIEQEEEAEVDIERINQEFGGSALVPPRISGNLAYLPCLQPPS